MIARYVLTCLASLAAAASLVVAEDVQADPVVVGVHLYTHHTNAEYHDNTPGLYAIFPVGVAGGKLTAGFYVNSLHQLNGERRHTFYVGQSWEWGRWGVVAALGTGYERKRYTFEVPRRRGGGTITYSAESGFSSTKLTPLIAPSVTIPEAQRYLGVTPRITFLPAKHSAVHLSIERSF